MGETTGFLKWKRATPTRRPVPVRLRDWKEVYEPFPRDALVTQAGRCMDCGIPFCNNGCPLGNLISDWNDLVYRDQWRDAVEWLHATNNFPEFTGRLCPASCEDACVLGINQDPVTIKQVEVEIVDRGWNEGWITPLEYLPVANRAQQGDLAASTITAKGKHVVIIGAGDTGADCLGTAHRQGAASVHQFEILPGRPTRARPTTPGRRGRTSSACRAWIPTSSPTCSTPTTTTRRWRTCSASPRVSTR